MMQNLVDIDEVIKKLDSKLPVCRVCLNLSMEYIEFDSALYVIDGADITYFDAFQFVLSHVKLFSGFETLCASCGNDLLNAFLFRKRVENADVILNKICYEETSVKLNTSDVKTEPTYDMLSEEFSLQVGIFTENPKLTGFDGGVHRDFIESNKAWSSSMDADSESHKKKANLIDISLSGEKCTFREVLKTHCMQHKVFNYDTSKQREKSMDTVGDLDTHVCFHKLSKVVITDSDKLCYLCKLCERKYKSEQDFIDPPPINMDEDKKPYCCRSWEDTSHKKNLLRMQTFRSHKTLNRKVVNSKKLKVEKKEKCTVCLKMVRKSFMEIHKEVHTGPRNSMCTECGKQFGSRLALKTHSLIHKQSGQFLCHICNKICQTMYALKSHIQFKHITDKSLVGGKKLKYQCEDCGLIFQYPSKLRVHQRKHNAETPYICPHCNRSYLRKDQFNIHMRYHNNDLPYNCDQCDKSYATKNNLTEHRKSVHDNVTYSCDNCDQKFKSVTGLRKHKFVHTGYPYVCPICGLGQPFRSGIKAHLLRVHKDTFTEEEFNETFPVVVPKSGFRRPKL